MGSSLELSHDEFLVLITGMYERMMEYEHPDLDLESLTPQQYVKYESIRRKLEDAAYREIDCTIQMKQ